MFGMGHWEILIIFVVILLIFGAKRIPEMAQGLGKGIREFRTAMRDVQEEIDVNPPPANPPAQAPTQTVSQSGDKEQSAS
jgi:TatA/E family protein of Tat protein translocase